MTMILQFKKTKIKIDSKLNIFNIEFEITQPNLYGQMGWEILICMMQK